MAKRKHSKHNIGIEARGKMIKTLYDLTAKAAGPKEEYQALKGGLNQIRKITNQRIETLVRMEQTTGYTSPALRELRESGFGGGISTRGYGETGEGLQGLREQYKALTTFLRRETSTATGLRERKARIEEDLYNAGFRGPRGGHLRLSKEQLTRYDDLAAKFYSETAKNIYYRASGGKVDQETLRARANAEIAKIMLEGDLDNALDNAQARLLEINEQGFKE